jgi:hypothetical protein
MDNDDVVATVAAATDAPDIPVEPAASAEPETVTLPKAQADALRRELAEEQRARKRLEDAQKKAKDEQAAEQGKWQELAQQREGELEKERGERTRVEHEARVTRLASKAKFLDPADVIGRITTDDGADDASVEAALARIATASPHLIAKETAVPEIGKVHSAANTATPGAAADGKPAPPAGKQPLQSLDEYEAPPQAERLGRMAEMDWLYLHEK